MSEEWLTDTEATKIVRRPGDTDEQVSKRMLAAYSSGKVRRRYNAELAAAKMDEVKAEIDAMIAVHRGPLIARHKRPEMSEAEFEAGLREQALETLLLVRFTEFERGSLLQWNGTPADPTPVPAKASPALIRETIAAIYADPAYQLPNGKPPNKVELVPIVKQRLADKGRTASWDEIQKIADEDEFKALRGQVGKRLH
jgi:hypothetical protein